MSLIPPSLCGTSPAALALYEKLYLAYLRCYRECNKTTVAIDPLKASGGSAPVPESSHKNLRRVTKSGRIEITCSMCATEFLSRNKFMHHLPACKMTYRQRSSTSTLKSRRERARKQKAQEHLTRQQTIERTTKFFADLAQRPLRTTKDPVGSPFQLEDGMHELSITNHHLTKDREVCNQFMEVTGADTFFCKKGQSTHVANFFTNSHDCVLLYDGNDTREPLRTIRDVYQEKILANQAPNIWQAALDRVRAERYVPVPEETEEEIEERRDLLAKELMKEREIVAAGSLDQDELAFFASAQPSGFGTEGSHARRESLFSRTGDDHLFDSSDDNDQVPSHPPSESEYEDAV